MGRLKEGWTKLINTKRYRSMIMFLVFVCVSTIFWLIMTLNDNAQDDFKVRIMVEDVPDSVTFITDVPEYIHVNVRDKGSTLFRSGILHKPELKVKFSQYSRDGVFKMSKSELNASMRLLFGPQAIINMSVDSIHCLYTTLPGKKVPLIIDAEVTSSFQSIISAKPYAVGGNTVTVYATPSVLDTITAVRTNKVIKHDVKESQEVEVSFVPIKGARIEPAKVKIVIPVEPLVLKHAMVDVKPINVPNGKSLLLFPSKVEVTYFAPMSQFDTASEDILVQADYNQLHDGSNFIPVSLDSYPGKYINIKLNTDSVECSVVSLQHR